MLIAGLFLLNDLFLKLSPPFEFIKYYVSFGLLCELVFETYLAKKLNFTFFISIIIILFLSGIHHFNKVKVLTSTHSFLCYNNSKRSD